jgi:hypothetical protein
MTCRFPFDPVGFTEEGKGHRDVTHDLQPLTQLLSGNPIPVSGMIRYALHIGNALRRIHAEGRCHAALTPALILVGESGARLLPAPPGVVGSPQPYTAPEVLRGEAVDTRTDIFAFGAVLYEMATGRRAFLARDAEELDEEIMSKGVSPTGHKGLDQVVQQCLAKDPAARWQNMQKVQMELKLVAIAEQQRETTTVADFEAVVRGELARQANAITELERAVTAQTSELTRAVTAALDDVQSQFTEVETFLTASQQRADHFAQSAAQALETTRQEIAALKTAIEGEVDGVARMVVGQASSIESIKAAMARSDDYVERVVDALDVLQSTVFAQPAGQETVAVAIAS